MKYHPIRDMHLGKKYEHKVDHYVKVVTIPNLKSTQVISFVKKKKKKSTT